jgi:hypothetical protein
MKNLSLQSSDYRRFAVITALGLLAGCAVKPVVQYTKIVKPVDMVGDEIDSFSLRATDILIEQLEPKKDADPKAAANFSIASVPVAFADYKVGMRKADSWGVSTNLTVVKLENTALIKEIGVDVVDSRADLLAKYGGIIVKLIGLVPFDSSGNPPSKQADL